jgi:hypothetical protein
MTELVEAARKEDLTAEEEPRPDHAPGEEAESLDGTRRRPERRRLRRWGGGPCHRGGARSRISHPRRRPDLRFSGGEAPC